MNNKKEKLLQIIRELETKNINGSLDKEIADLKKEVEDLEGIKEIEDKLNNISQHLPSAWKDYLITSSAIITPLLLAKILWEHYQKYETNKNLDEMMAKIKKNAKN